MQIFFYGLFMDQRMLEAKGIEVRSLEPASFTGFELRIAERATLVRRDGSNVYGVVAEIGPVAVDELYSEQSVADYVPESVSVNLGDGRSIDAVCYNLPGDKIQGANPAYAAKLHELAKRLGLPSDYCEEIAREA